MSDRRSLGDRACRGAVDRSGSSQGCGPRVDRFSGRHAPSHQSKHLVLRGAWARGDEVSPGADGPPGGARLHGRGGRRRYAHRLRGVLWFGRARGRHPRRVRRATRPFAGCRSRAPGASGRGCGTWVRPQHFWNRQHGRRDRCEAGHRVRGDLRHHSSLRHARRGDRHRQDLHAARRAVRGLRHHPCLAREPRRSATPRPTSP